MTLFLHTSTATCHLGLADGERLLAQDSFPVDRTLASTLADRIHQFLKAHRSPHFALGASRGRQLEALTKIVVHSGPGSFTSLRIGITTANALGYALGIPVVGISEAITDLKNLLKASKHVKPDPENLALPHYGQEPQIGP